MEIVFGVFVRLIRASFMCWGNSWHPSDMWFERIAENWRDNSLFGIVSSSSSHFYESPLGSVLKGHLVGLSFICSWHQLSDIQGSYGCHLWGDESWIFLFTFLEIQVRWDSWELIYFRACLNFGLKIFESWRWVNVFDADIAPLVNSWEVSGLRIYTWIFIWPFGVGMAKILCTAWPTMSCVDFPSPKEVIWGGGGLLPRLILPHIYKI